MDEKTIDDIIKEPFFGGDYEIHIECRIESKARFLRYIRLKKMIMGEKYNLIIHIKNKGSKPFPEKYLHLYFFVKSYPDLNSGFEFIIEEGKIKPNESTNRSFELKCLSEGLAIVIARFEFDKMVQPFYVTIPYGWSTLTPSSRADEGSGTTWNHVNTDPLHTFWVHRWQEIFAFWALLLSASAAIIAAIGLFFR